MFVQGNSKWIKGRGRDRIDIAFTPFFTFTLTSTRFALLIKKFHSIPGVQIFMRSDRNSCQTREQHKKNLNSRGWIGVQKTFPSNLTVLVLTFFIIWIKTESDATPENGAKKRSTNSNWWSEPIAKMWSTAKLSAVLSRLGNLKLERSWRGLKSCFN